ncbi:MAG: GNAT family N-acetyltransferase [Rhodobacteraceae bacterium]|nr:GNAT family N-acetyltransferase [Paracoccaceae bacterium]MBT6521630.1 GNAT family N-acetyltransferase [Paracoccaceae bacterium]MBT7343683.1 GNAT family N-acetyltransferase [Paracoccaceae bacterium]
MPSVQRLYQAINTTWPARTTRQEAGWEIRDGAGGGKRVSAVTSAQTELPDIDWVEARLSEQGQEHLFMIRDGDEILDAALAARGYEIIDPVTLYLCETAPLRPASLPRAQSYCIWEPLHIMREIWAAGGIRDRRIALMHRVQSPKTALLARSGDSPAGVGFLALDGEIAMLHAVEVLPEFRRTGVAKKLMAQAAKWAEGHGAKYMALMTTRDNQAANRLYSSLGMRPVGRYHYRIKDTT